MFNLANMSFNAIREKKFSRTCKFRPSDKKDIVEYQFSYFSSFICFVGTQIHLLNETVIWTPKHMFKHYRTVAFKRLRIWTYIIFDLVFLLKTP